MYSPTSALLFLNYKSVKSGEEVAGGGRKENTIRYEEFFFIAIYFSTFRPSSITMP